jgi:hypothetical protein
MNIPQEAIEAAAEAMEPVVKKLEALILARAALEAAAQYIAANAWDEGYTMCEIDSPYEPDTRNPYRKDA